MVAGSGTAVICACTVVTPLFVEGGTRGSGLLVMLDFQKNSRAVQKKSGAAPVGRGP